MTGGPTAKKPRAARTNFNSHAERILTAQIAPRLAAWKAARGSNEKKWVEDEVWAVVRADSACEADAWGDDAVRNKFKSFKLSAD